MYIVYFFLCKEPKNSCRASLSNSILRERAACCFKAVQSRGCHHELIPLFTYDKIRSDTFKSSRLFLVLSFILYLLLHLRMQPCWWSPGWLHGTPCFQKRLLPPFHFLQFLLHFTLETFTSIRHSFIHLSIHCLRSQVNLPSMNE